MFDCFTSDASQNPQCKSILEVPQVQRRVRSYRSRRVPQPDLYQPVCQRKKKSKGTFQLKSKGRQSEACRSQKSEVSQWEIAEVGADVGNGGGEIKSCGIQKKILPEAYRCVDVAYVERHPLQARDIMPTSTSNGTVESVMTVPRSLDKPVVPMDVEHDISITQRQLGSGKKRRKATAPYNPYQYKLMRDAARSDDNKHVGSNDSLRDSDTVDNNSKVESSVEYMAENVYRNDRSTVLCLSSGAEGANYKWGSSCSTDDGGVIMSAVEEMLNQRGKGDMGKENMSDEEQDSKRKRSGVSKFVKGNAGENDKDLSSCSSPPSDETLPINSTGNSSEMLNEDTISCDLISIQNLGNQANEIGQLIVKNKDKIKKFKESNVKMNEETACCALIEGKQDEAAAEANTKQIDTPIDNILIVGDAEGQAAEEANTKLVSTSIHDIVNDNDTEDDVDELVDAIDPKLEAKINRLKRIVSAVKAANFRSRRMW